MVGAPRTEIYGPFEVLERLGIGGMATVHRAVERGAEGFERVVALKRLLPHLAEDEEFVRAFVREAKLASLLRHANIVQIYELGRVGASYFISMEYIPGRDLRVILRQARRVCGPPPIEVALSLLSELLHALDHAHRQRGPDGRALGLVHRDISPSNLLISHTGQLKIIDFGIAKATIGHLMTHTGRVKGKLSYMAPEALAGQLDARSDLFSVSVIAHELLTATPLFASKEDLQTIDKLQNMQPPPPSQKNPGVPPELDEIVLRGLAKDPATRWQSASEMRAAVVELASGRYRLASKREVCHWIEEAFEMQAPSRRRLPLTAPGTPSDGRRSGVMAAATEADDELMDLVWGGNGPSASQPVVLDEVPDVSARISGVHPMPVRPPGLADPPDPFDVASDVDLEEPTSDMVRPVEHTRPPPARGRRPQPRAAARSGQVPTVSDVFSLGGTPSAVSWTDSHGRASSRPSEWAFSASHTTDPQQPSGVIDPSAAGARRTLGGYPETATPAAPPRKRTSIFPVLAAAVAVAGAGAAIAWVVSMRPENDSTRDAASAAQQKVVAGAQLPPPAVRALPEESAPASTEPAPAAQPAVPPANEVVTENKVTDARDDAEKAEAEKADKAAKKARAAAEAEEKARADKAADDKAGEEEERDGKSRKGRVARTKRDAAEARARAADELDEEDGDAPDDEGERVAIQTPRSRAADSTAGRATRSTSEDKELEPLPVPVTEPAEPPRPRKPVIITPDRAIRQSGSVPRLRFPPWEQAPAAVAYKLCVDPSGAVSSVTVLSKLSGGVRAAVVDGLKRWRYKPVMQAGQKVPACFATTFKVELK